MRKTKILIAVLAILPAVLFGVAPSKHDFEVVQVASGIYAFIANESNSGAVQGNVIKPAAACV